LTKSLTEAKLPADFRVLSPEEIDKLAAEKNADRLIKYFGQYYKRDWKKISKKLHALGLKKVTPHSARNTFKQ